MTGWFVTWALGVVAVLAIVANRRYHWLAGWRYDWTRARHLVQEGERENLRLRGSLADPMAPMGSMILDEERELYPLPWPRLEGDWLPKVPGPDWREQTAAALAPEALNDQPDPYLDALTAQYGSEWDFEDPCPDCGSIDGTMCGAPSGELCRWRTEDSGPGAPSSGSDTPGPDFNLPAAVQAAADAGGGIVQIPPGTYGPYFATTVDGQAAWLGAQLAELYAWVRAQYQEAAA